MKLKKIIIKKYDKDFEVFKNPCHFIHDFYYEVKRFYSGFQLRGKVFFKFSLIKYLSNIDKLPIRADEYNRTEFYAYVFPWITSILVHSFFFYTFFYEIAFLIEHGFAHKTYELETLNYDPETGIPTETACFKNFYYPFIYFLAFKSVEV